MFEKERDEMGYQAASDRYNTMKYHKCGNSGLKLPAISLGLWKQDTRCGMALMGTAVAGNISLPVWIRA